MMVLRCRGAQETDKYHSYDTVAHPHARPASSSFHCSNPKGVCSVDREAPRDTCDHQEGLVRELYRL